MQRVVICLLSLFAVAFSQLIIGHPCSQIWWSTACNVTAGYVGIGTENPQVRLHIISQGSGSAGIIVEAPDSYGSWIIIKNTDRSWKIGEDWYEKFMIVDNTANAIRFTIDTSGKVGIETVNPQAKLHVYGNNADVVIGNLSSGYSALRFLGSYSDDYAYIQAGTSPTDTTAKLRITRYSTSNKPLQRLEIYAQTTYIAGDVNVQNPSTGKAKIELIGTAGYTPYACINLKDTNGYLWHINARGNHEFWISFYHPGDPAGEYWYDPLKIKPDTPDNTLVIESHGIGIGMYNPLARIHLKNYGYLPAGWTDTEWTRAFWGNSIEIGAGWHYAHDKDTGQPKYSNSKYGITILWGSDNIFIGLSDRGGGTYSSDFGDDKDAIIGWGDNDDDNLVFKWRKYDGTEKTVMILTPSGNVGIGTTNPSERLEVAGNIKASKFIDRDNTNYYVDPAGTSYLKDVLVSSIKYSSYYYPYVYVIQINQPDSTSSTDWTVVDYSDFYLKKYFPKGNLRLEVYFRVNSQGDFCYYAIRCGAYYYCSVSDHTDTWTWLHTTCDIPDDIHNCIIVMKSSSPLHTCNFAAATIYVYSTPY